MTKNDLNNCYYSPNEGHTLCTHRDWCIFKKERIQLEQQIHDLRCKLENLTRQYYSQLTEYGGEEMIEEKELRTIKEDLERLEEYYEKRRQNI